MMTMESVIERGQARCPRCVAVADYVFVEVSTNLLRYEVDCRRCGEAYREDHGPVPPTFGAVAAIEEWHPQVKVSVRERVSPYVAALRTRTTSLDLRPPIKLTPSSLLLRLTRALYQ
jgi:hypothetical protein